MPQVIHLRLARLADTRQIALMSRDQIEMGLDWRWTPSRVAEQIHCPDTVVLIAGDQKAIAGFAIMHFGEEIAHLNLLAVKESHQRLGIGSRLLNWLEESSIVAGVATIELEVRARNRGARAFYKSLGYEEVRLLPGYYSGRESAIQMARFLRMSEGLNEWLRHR